MRCVEVVLTSAVSGNGEGTAVALDVLRATTTIVAAMENGAREIIPADGEGEAIGLMREAGDALLAGERDSWRPEGFDLGNSPLEFTAERVRGKKIVLTTTNGTRLLRRIAGHRRVLVGALRNAAAVAGAIAAGDGNVRIFCAGRRGSECFEDNLAAGAIVSHLLEKGDYSLDGNADKVLALFLENKNEVRAAVMACEHGKRLVEKGFGEDVDFCSRLNVSSIVPVFDGKKIFVAD